MTDRQIRCFLALYETLKFSAAARQLFLTQPTLSYQIRTLEEELGTPLFTRTTCRVEPTEAGQLFAAFAQNVRLTTVNSSSFVFRILLRQSESWTTSGE